MGRHKKISDFSEHVILAFIENLRDGNSIHVSARMAGFNWAYNRKEILKNDSAKNAYLEYINKNKKRSC